MMRVVSRYVLTESLRVFGLCMAAFLMIYMLVDLFDRLEGLRPGCPAILHCGTNHTASIGDEVGHDQDTTAVQRLFCAG